MTKFGTPPSMLARTYGPDTSIAAAQAVDSTALEKMVYERIKKYGARGCISDEVRAFYANFPYSSITARYAALLRKGFIIDTGTRRPGKSGRMQRVMVAV